VFQINQSQVIALPQFAPLSVPMVFHLLGISSADIFLGRFQSSRDQLSQDFRLLETHIIAARDAIFDLMHREKNVSIKWFQTSVKQIHNEKNEHTNKGVSLQTISNWRENHVLHFQRWGELDLDSAASVLIASMIDERKRHFLPSSVDDDEPIWWCYSQAPPLRSGVQAPIIPRPWPLPVHLEPGTLLWSRWPVFDSTWLQFPRIGAMRFSTIDKTALALWDPSLDCSEIGHLLDTQGYFAEVSDGTLRSLAQSTLYKLSVGRLSPSILFDLPLLWHRRTIWPGEILL
jgi:hypothetical protein